MADIQQIYVHPGCPHCWKVFVASEFVGKAADTVFLTWEQIKQPDYLAKNPTGKVPCITTAQGPVFESHAILRAIARAFPDKKLYGNGNYQAAQVDQWLDFISGTLLDPLYKNFGPVTGIRAPLDEKARNEAKTQLNNVLTILDKHLNERKFLVGDNVTIADISLVVMIRNPTATIFDEEFRKQFANLFKYYDAVANLPEFRASLGRVRYATKRWEEYTPPAPVKEEKKQPEKKEQPKKKKDDEEEEEETAAPKKDDAKAELESLPPTTFNFFDFKTLFVNATDKNEALKVFWEQFDPNGYSLWFIEYEKAEGEGKVLFLTNNLMNGFLQRLDHFRKYAFGVYGVYGDEPNLEVRGIFCWRGTQIPLMIKEHDQYDYHKFTKLDHTNEAHRNRVAEFWTKLVEDEDVVDGLKARTVKYFK